MPVVPLVQWRLLLACCSAGESRYEERKLVHFATDHLTHGCCITRKLGLCFQPIFGEQVLLQS